MVNQLANLEQSRVASERVFELLEEKGSSRRRTYTSLTRKCEV